jgi:ribosome maturation factor RimP
VGANAPAYAISVGILFGLIRSTEVPKECVGGEPTHFCVPTPETTGGEAPLRSEDVTERVRALVGPALEDVGLELFDVERVGTVLRVTVDRAGGVDLDAISDATRRISDVLDQDPDLNTALSGRYLLEVSSPGVERQLRTPAHFDRAVGSTVVVKTHPTAEGDRRVEGVLEAADADGIVVAGRSIPYADIERARTRFVWPEPRKAGARP